MGNPALQKRQVQTGYAVVRSANCPTEKPTLQVIRVPKRLMLPSNWHSTLQKRQLCKWGKESPECSGSGFRQTQAQLWPHTHARPQATKQLQATLCLMYSVSGLRLCRMMMAGKRGGTRQRENKKKTYCTQGLWRCVQRGISVSCKVLQNFTSRVAG